MKFRWKDQRSDVVKVERPAFRCCESNRRATQGSSGESSSDRKRWEKTRVTRCMGEGVWRIDDSMGPWDLDRWQCPIQELLNWVSPSACWSRTSKVVPALSTASLCFPLPKICSAVSGNVGFLEIHTTVPLLLIGKEGVCTWSYCHPHTHTHWCHWCRGLEDCSKQKSFFLLLSGVSYNRHLQVSIEQPLEALCWFKMVQTCSNHTVFGGAVFGDLLPARILWDVYHVNFNFNPIVVRIRILWFPTRPAHRWW